MSQTLYTRLGGYDAIAAVASDLVSRLHQTPSWDGSGSIAEPMESAANCNC